MDTSGQIHDHPPLLIAERLELWFLIAFIFIFEGIVANFIDAWQYHRGS